MTDDIFAEFDEVMGTNTPPSVLPKVETPQTEPPSTAQTEPPSLQASKPLTRTEIVDILTRKDGEALLDAVLNDRVVILSMQRADAFEQYQKDMTENVKPFLSILSEVAAPLAQRGSDVSKVLELITTASAEGLGIGTIQKVMSIAPLVTDLKQTINLQRLKDIDRKALEIMCVRLGIDVEPLITLIAILETSQKQIPKVIPKEETEGGIFGRFKGFME